MDETLDGCALDFTKDETTKEDLKSLLLPPDETEGEDLDAS